LKCPYCGTTFFEKAEQCPDCGGPIRYERKKGERAEEEGRRSDPHSYKGRPPHPGVRARPGGFFANAGRIFAGEIFSLDRDSARALLRSHLFWPVFIFAAMPLVLEFFGIEQIPGMTVYFSLIWLAIFYRLFGLQGHPFRFCLYFYFLSMVMSFFVFQGLYYFTRGLYTMIESPDLVARLAGFVLGVGLTEEMAKIAPVVLMFLLVGRRRMILPEPDYLLYGLVAGLSFAAMENIGYITGSAVAERLGGAATIGLSASVTISRIIMTPFIHACLSGVLGYFIGRIGSAGEGRASGIAFFLVGLTVVSVLHGAYDFLAGTPAGTPLAAAALGLLYFILLVCVLRARTLSDGVEAATALVKRRLF